MQGPILGIFIFVFGLLVGSFLNCVIYRLAASERRASPSSTGREKGQSFLKGRSFCPHCRHQLGVWDLVPILSFLWLRGRCRYCREKISLQYPLVELATAFLFLFIFLDNATMVAIASLYYWAMACFLIVIFVYDLRHYIIPDKVVYPAILIALIFNVLTPGVFSLTPGVFISALGAGGFFLAIVLLSWGRWMGVGDIKLAFLMGLILGWPNIFVALFLAFVSGAIIGIALMTLGKKTMKSEVPFGPFLVFGTFCGLFWGGEIINWYLNLFLW